MKVLVTFVALFSIGIIVIAQAAPVPALPSAKENILTAARDGNRLFVQRTGEIKVEMFPESKQKYFAKRFNGQICFRLQKKGKCHELVYHENGRTFRAKRIE